MGPRNHAIDDAQNALGKSHLRRSNQVLRVDSGREIASTGILGAARRQESSCCYPAGLSPPSHDALTEWSERGRRDINGQACAGKQVSSRAASKPMTRDKKLHAPVFSDRKS